MVFYIGLFIINSLTHTIKIKSLLKIHDEYVKYLNQIINESSDSDFDRLIKLIEKIHK